MTEENESFIGRKAAAQKYRRGERTLERDISQALRLQDEQFLGNLQLRTKNGDVLPGLEVTFERIDQLKNSGQVPTWEIAESFLAAKYGLRSEQPQQDRPLTDPGQGSPAPESATTSTSTTDNNSQQSQTTGPTESGLPPLPRNPTEQAELLKALYLNLQRRLEAEHARHEKIFALIETIPKQQEQTNVLLREFQELMKSGNASLGLPSKVEAKERPESQVVEAVTIESEPAVVSEITKSSKSPVTEKKPTKTPKKTRSASPRKKKPRKSAKKPSTIFEKHLPTFSGVIASISPKKK